MLSSARSQRAKEPLNTVPTGQHGAGRGQWVGNIGPGGHPASSSGHTALGCPVAVGSRLSQSQLGCFSNAEELSVEESRPGPGASVVCADSVGLQGPHPTPPQPALAIHPLLDLLGHGAWVPGQLAP